MSSDSLELLELLLYLFEKLIAAPLPSDIIAPVCPLQLSWTAWDASTHQLTHVIFSAERLSFVCLVPWRY